MTAIRFEIRDDRSRVKVPNGMLSTPASTTAEQDARRILADFPPGWRVRLWKDVNLVGSIDSLGKPDADVRSDKA
jgi:hypothetical protein